MATTTSQDVQSRFRKRRAIAWAGTASIFGTMAAAVIGLDEGKQELFGIGHPFPAYVVSAIVTVAFIVHFVVWRCPACRARLANALNPRFCWRCGVALASNGHPRG
jgi:hypothetical protein